jgi:diguanylate cyclase (GGDEF)-like protein/PAS domain S-box-containing protein
MVASRDFTVDAIFPGCLRSGKRVKRKNRHPWPQTVPPPERMAWSMGLLAETDVLNVIMNLGRDMIYFKDRQSRFFFVSRTEALRFGTADVKKIIGTSDFDHFTREHAIPAFRDEQRIIRTGKPVVEIVEKETWPDGSFNWVSTSKFPLRDKKGRIIGTWGISRDITALKRAEDELEAANRELSQLSRTDTLSGLLNRRDLYETLKKNFKLKSRAKDSGCEGEFSVVLFDIDRFKTINDEYGHLAGDQVIRHMAGILQSGIRRTDSLFRYGGDEFLLLLPDTGLEGGRFVAAKLLGRIRKTPCLFGGWQIRLTSSAGVAGSKETRSASVLLKKADRRLYLSKRAGRDRAT